MHIYSTAFLTLLCAHFQLSLTADLERATLSTNRRRTLDNKESRQSSKEDGSNGRTVDPVFMKNLNEVLMKFLREVANMVKQSPQDVDHVQQVDVSRMLTGSLAASAMDAPVSVPSAQVMLTIRPPLPQRATTTPDPVPFLSRPPSPAGLALATTMRPQTPSVNALQQRLSPGVPANHVVHLVTAEALQTVTRKSEQQGLNPANTMPPVSKHVQNSEHSPTRFNRTRLLQRQRTKPTSPRINEHFTSNKITANQFSHHRVLPRNEQPRRVSGRAQIPVRPAQNSKEKDVQVKTLEAAAGTTAQVFRRRQGPAQLPRTLEIVLQRHRSSDLTQTITQPASPNVMNRNTAPNASRSQPQVTVDTTKKLTPALNLNFNKMRRVNLNRMASVLGGSRPKVLLQASSASRLQLRPQQSTASSPKVVAVTHRQAFDNQEVSFPTKGVSATSAPPILQPHLLVPTTKKVAEQVLPLAPSSSSHVFLYSTTALPKQNRQDSSSREAILNDLIFDLFARLGVRSFVVKTDKGAIEGVADPSRTKFVPVEVVEEPSRSSFRWRTSPLSDRQGRDFEHSELKSAVGGVKGSAEGTRSFGPTLPAARNPPFFRYGRRIWRRTNGITRKQLRRALLRNSMT